MEGATGVDAALAGASATGADVAEGASDFGVQALARKSTANAAGFQMGSGIMTFDGVSLKHALLGVLCGASRLSASR
jgi:hypothetical protein